MTTYPNDDDGDTLRQLAAMGIDMSQSMDVDVQIAAPDEAVAKRVAEGAGELGYHTSIYYDDEETDLKDDAPLWTCECTKTMVLTHDAIMAAQFELDAIAKPLGAYADGWGTMGNQATAPRPWWKFW